MVTRGHSYPTSDQRMVRPSGGHHPTAQPERQEPLLMKKLTLCLLAAGLAITAGCATKKDALPAGSDKFPTTSTTVAAGAVKTDATVKAAVTTTTEPEPTASTCDVTREALLTGTPAEILASMKALMADKTADATAREYADYYVNRDKASAQMREMDVGLIRMSCSS